MAFNKPVKGERDWADKLNGTLDDLKQRADGAQETANGAARADVFRHEDLDGTLSYHESRVILGSVHNAINDASGDAVILGGGRALMENVIGGREDNINNFEASNLPADKAVAADYSAIVYGYDSVNNALASVVGGQHCLIREAATSGHHTIFGGSLHEIAAGGYHTILGGTQHAITSPDNSCTIAGGEDNTITAGARSAILGGYANTVSADYGLVLGGTNNLASGSSSAVVGGNNNVASGQGATVLGRGNTAAQIDSVAMGNASSPSQRGGVAQATGSFSAAGDAQAETFVARRSTSDATTTNLGIAGSASAPIMPTGTTWAVRGMVVARNADDAVSESAAWGFTALVRRSSTGAATIVGTPTITQVAADAGAAGWTVALTTGTSPLYVNVTGQAGKTIRWVARFDIVQVQG